MRYANDYKSRFRILKGGLISLVVSVNLYGAPTGGTVVSGSATINQNGTVTNINQSSNKAIINWQGFGIANNESVNFNQPSSSSIVLNRVIGNEKSIIDGALNANGQVWLINSNGVLFGKNARVNTAGIVASTKDISNEDFLNGNYNFKGNSNASIVNEGEIKSLEKTYATFIANSVVNNGKIEVYKGNINLVGASDVTLDLGDSVTYRVNKGVLDALVENNNLIVANGGNVYLTTNAKDELLKGAVNNSGIIEANSLDDLNGKVILFANGGTTNISGTIEAKNGFVETSGKDLSVTDGAKIRAGHWLIDPENITIGASGGNAVTGDGSNINSMAGYVDVSAESIQDSLASGNVTLQATKDITVGVSIIWNSGNKLTLDAGENIYINKFMNASGGSGGSLFLKYGGDYYIGMSTTGTLGFNAKILLREGQNFSTQKTGEAKIDYTVINTQEGLQNIKNNLTGNYALGGTIDFAGRDWDNNPWQQIGTGHGEGASFRGRLEGLGNSIQSFSASQSGDMYSTQTGMFRFANATFQNFALKNVEINAEGGGNSFGSLVAEAQAGSYKNIIVTGNVDGGYTTGGLIGVAVGSKIDNVHSTVNVSGYNDVSATGSGVGGIVGSADSGTVISNSSFRGTVSNGNINSETFNTGGIAGFVRGNNTKIINSYSHAPIIGSKNVGGIAGRVINNATIENSYSKGTIEGAESVGGLVGSIITSSSLEKSFSTAEVHGNKYVGGLVGQANQGNINDSYSISNYVGGDDATFVGGIVGQTNWSVGSSYFAGTNIKGTANVGGVTGDYNDNPSNIASSFYDKTLNPNSTFIDLSYGKTTSELKTYSTFSWSIMQDANLGSIYPQLRWTFKAGETTAPDYVVWVIGSSNPQPNPNPDPQPNPNNGGTTNETQKEVDRVVEHIEQITNSTTIAVENYMQESNIAQNSSEKADGFGQNMNTLALNDRVSIEVVGDGLKMPDSVDSSNKDEE